MCRIEDDYRDSACDPAEAAGDLDAWMDAAEAAYNAATAEAVAQRLAEQSQGREFPEMDETYPW